MVYNPVVGRREIIPTMQVENMAADQPKYTVTVFELLQTDPTDAIVTIEFNLI